MGLNCWLFCLICLPSYSRVFCFRAVQHSSTRLYWETMVSVISLLSLLFLALLWSQTRCECQDRASFLRNELPVWQGWPSARSTSLPGPKKSLGIDRLPNISTVFKQAAFQCSPQEGQWAPGAITIIICFDTFDRSASNACEKGTTGSFRRDTASQTCPWPWGERRTCSWGTWSCKTCWTRPPWFLATTHRLVAADPSFLVIFSCFCRYCRSFLVAVVLPCSHAFVPSPKLFSSSTLMISVWALAGCQRKSARPAIAIGNRTGREVVDEE